jgi:hypothetical protein
MSSDIFGYVRAPKPEGVFSSEDSMLVIGSVNATSKAYLVQQWNVDYRQEVQELFELGSNRLFWQKGRPTGQGTIQRVLGGADADTGTADGLFPVDAYDLCKGGATMTIKAVGGHCREPVAGSTFGMNKGIRVEMDGVVITSIGFSMSVQDVKLMENYQWRFGHLKLVGEMRVDYSAPGAA